MSKMVLAPLFLLVLFFIRPLMQLVALAVTVVWVGAETIAGFVRLGGKIQTIPPGPSGFMHRLNTDPERRGE